MDHHGRRSLDGQNRVPREVISFETVAAKPSRCCVMTNGTDLPILSG
jgi:hypothetical protein